MILGGPVDEAAVGVVAFDVAGAVDPPVQGVDRVAAPARHTAAQFGPGFAGAGVAVHGVVDAGQFVGEVVDGGVFVAGPLQADLQPVDAGTDLALAAGVGPVAAPQVDEGGDGDEADLILWPVAVAVAEGGGA